MPQVSTFHLRLTLNIFIFPVNGEVCMVLVVVATKFSHLNQR